MMLIKVLCKLVHRHKISVFKKAGDSTTLTVQVNNIASIVQYKYEFAFDGNTFTLLYIKENIYKYAF